MNNLKFYIYTPLDKFVIQNNNDLIVVFFRSGAFGEIDIRFKPNLIENHITEILQQRPNLQPMIEVSITDFRSEMLKHEKIGEHFVSLFELIRKADFNQHNKN